MQTRVDEIADGIYRLSTFVPQVAAPAGFVFNQFLVAGDEPLLFHTGAWSRTSSCPRPTASRGWASSWLVRSSASPATSDRNAAGRGPALT